jgi:uncharacterized protein YjbI with pentapeptide repeats
MFSETDYSEQTFEGLDARENSVSEKEFHSCVFIACQFSEFKNCKFVDCTFRQCDLSNLKVTGSSFRGLKAESCKLIGVNWPAARLVMHFELTECVLNYSNFIGLDLRKSRLQNCVAREVELADTNLSESDCRGTDFKGARFGHTNLSKADFRGALNYAIHPLDNNLKKAKFSLPEATLLLYGLGVEIE